MTAARSTSRPVAVVVLVVTASEFPVSPGVSSEGSGLQIRHRRFDSDRSLSTEDPRDVRVRPGVTGVFRFSIARGTYDETMATTPSQSRITVEPGKCGGRPCIRHMRIRVKDVLEMLASGASEDQILADYPDLEREDIRACLEYAAQYFDHPVFVG